MKEKWYLYWLVVLVTLSADQLAKLFTLENFYLGQSKVIISNVLYWTYVVNPGGAFGFFSDVSYAQIHYFFIVISMLALIIAVYFVYSIVSVGNTFAIVAFGLISGGILGNLVDRIRFGFVIDFVDFHINQRWSFPAFNLADLSIVIGGLYLIIRWAFLGDAGRLADEGEKTTKEEI